MLVAMGATAALAVGTMAPSYAIKPKGTGGTCVNYAGVPTAPAGKIPRDDVFKIGKDPIAKWVKAHPSRAKAAAAADTTIRVPVAFHVIRKNSTLAGGNVPRSQIEEQITVLNDAFADAGFRFVLSKVTRTTKVSWFHLPYTNGYGEPRYFRGSSKEIAMKKALHTGDSETLNLYSADLGKRLLGYAWLPADFSGDNGTPLPRFYDGVVLAFQSLPGGAYRPIGYGEGDTGTHEVGHWLGLYHTFDNGCTEPGDYIDDTPFEAVPAFECDERDTCPQPGTDPITNFMDYTDDLCMNHFTDDQNERMRVQWEAYRDLG
jgi:hypothetical protein